MRRPHHIAQSVLHALGLSLRPLLVMFCVAGVASGVLWIATSHSNERTRRVAVKAQNASITADKAASEARSAARAANQSAAKAIANGNRSACGFRTLLIPLKTRTELALAKPGISAKDKASAEQAIKVYKELLDSQRTEPPNLRCASLAGE